MKKTACFVAAVAVAVAAILVLRFFSAEPVSAQNAVSERTSKVLQAKIDAIQAAEKAGNQTGRTVEVTEPELESYVLYGMKDQIPARVETIDSGSCL